MADTGILKNSGIKLEYLIWSHFRLYFTLLDLVLTYKLSFFSDRSEVLRIKNIVQKN